MKFTKKMKIIKEQNVPVDIIVYECLKRDRIKLDEIKQSVPEKKERELAREKWKGK